MNTKLTRTLLITAVLAVFGLSAAHAQPEGSFRGNIISDGPQFEIFLSSFAADLPANLEGRYETQIGLRGAYHFNDRVAVEGSLSKWGNFDAYMADLSAKLYLKNRGRVAAYAVGGPGLIFGNDYGSDDVTLHLGLGLEIAAGQHLYVRPEVRGVALADDVSNTEALFALGVGWRM